jgi:hypothetical protein
MRRCLPSQDALAALASATAAAPEMEHLVDPRVHRSGSTSTAAANNNSSSGSGILGSLGVRSRNSNAFAAPMDKLDRMA